VKQYSLPQALNSCKGSNIHHSKRQGVAPETIFYTSQTLQHIRSDNIGSAESDKCPIISVRLISAEIYDNIGSARIYIYTIGWGGPMIFISNMMV
jgi:hypothetical protein